MINCNYRLTDQWEEEVSYPEPYEDIEGVGVLVGFLGTAWLMIAMLLVYYLVFYDPELDPFADKSCQGRTQAVFKANPIDEMLLGFIRRCNRKILGRFGCFGKDGPSPSLSRLRQSMTRCILNFVDVQLIAGLGILISGFLSLNQELSAYHWSMVVYLAWLSNITHLSGLTALRGYFHFRQRERGWRLALMFLVMVLLLIALGPTAFFNWRGYGRYVVEPASFAICYFNPGKSLEAYQATKEMQDPYWFTPFSQSMAFQDVVVSMALVTLNFFTKALRTFRSISQALNGTVRRKTARAQCVWIDL
ncbi:hypothetical protein BHE90_004416 [Fusarium euwallaceae]|uniref:Uncharacterized protein n=1 Tax=Fusarium euwallaceae TaxID=1147111 RepID=A0A430LZC9_9HYPO|nr:hypothetical protein BHE90_004416 [Fusarium euwallaceae]